MRLKSKQEIHLCVLYTLYTLIEDTFTYSCMKQSVYIDAKEAENLSLLGGAEKTVRGGTCILMLLTIKSQVWIFPLVVL